MEWIKYLIYGNGRWMSRFECTSNDSVALGVSVACVACMAILYAWYAYQSHVELSVVRETHFREHLIELRNVFLVCGSLHVLQATVCWVVPIYYLVAVGMAFNCWQMFRLLASKRHIYAIQQHTAGMVAAQHLENIKLVIAEQKTTNLTNQLAKIEAIVRLADLDE